MKNLLFIIISLSFLFISQSDVFAQKKKKIKEPTDNKQSKEIIQEKSVPAKKIEDPYDFKFKLEKTNQFFQLFEANKTPPKRGEFETKEEYEKRLPKPFDSSQILFFRVNNSFKYKYDIDSQNLMFFAGEKIDYSGLTEYNPINSFPIIIEREFEDKGSYEASNAYGRTVTVEKTWVTDYVIYFMNKDKWPPNSIDIHKGSFKIECNKEPKEAERLSKETEIIIAVKFFEYKQSNFECIFSSKPTIDKPREMALFTYGINGNLVRIILWDKTKKEIVAEININQ